jgi:hypothetical protein
VVRIIRRVVSFVGSLTLLLGGLWLLIRQGTTYGLALRMGTAAVFCMTLLGGAWFYEDFVKPFLAKDRSDG